MELAFLGTGNAFSRERHNGAVVVDRRILLDAGAPLMVQMERLDIDPDRIEVLFLSHFHGDHMAGLLPYLAYRGFNGLGPFTVVAPEGGESRLNQMMRACWDSWDDWLTDRFDLRHVVAMPQGQAAGICFTTVQLRHGKVTGTGYRLDLDDRVLVYAGDTEMTPELDELVAGADVAITEATAPHPVETHTSWEEAIALAARHPQTRFIFNHLSGSGLEGAAEDLQVVEV
jgi:ribonuclease BN (tRNA processing enzyme)